MSSAADEALQRAKAIAARLQQESSGVTASAAAASPTTTTTTGSTSKRRRWGLAPDGPTETATAAAASGDSDANKRLKPDAAPAKSVEKLSKRMWISTSAQRPAIHFVNFMKDDLELVPSKMSIQQEKDILSVSLEGRGSGGKQPQTGVPLEPLHVLIEASSQDILSQAEMIVDELLQRAEEEPVHPDIIAAAIADGSETAGSEAKKSVSSTSMALATIQDPSMTRATNTAYRPASVAQLIGQVNHGGGPGGGDGGGGEWVEEVIPVPVGLVGFIIGKGGENIAMLQSRTGARVQVQRETDSAAAASVTHRNIQVSAPNHQALEQCKQLIQSTVQEKSKMLTGSSGGGNMNRKDAMRLEEALAQGHVHVKLPIPDDDVGLVIGKGGATIRSLQDRTGASIQVPSAQESIEGKRMVHITHPTQQGAEHAQRLIQELLQSNNNNSQAQSGGANQNNNNANNNNNVGNNPSEPQVTATMMIPDADVGLIIGRQGVVIRYLQDSTRTKIQIPPHCLPGQDHRMATITGPTQGCAQAQSMMGQILSDQSSAGVMAQAPPTAGGGEGAGNYGNVYNSQPKRADANQEYSADWAAYHAAQAAAAAHPVAPYAHPHPAAYGAAPYNPYPQQQQQQQHWGGAPAAAAPVVAAPVAPPAHEAYYEQFFRYAYYYGEPAARQYYGAWAPPVGTANPYGVNPNGVQPAPAAAPMAAAPTGAPASAPAPSAHHAGDSDPQYGERRETSVRKVSNLPAWMNKS